jgi:hypothetical protein
MKYKFTAIGVFSLFLTILLFFALRDGDIVFPSEVRYGTMTRTSEGKDFFMEKELKITNKTSREIRIEEVHVSCPCLFISNEFKRVLASGETVSLKTRMTLNEKESTGRVVDVLIKTNHAKYAQFKITALGRVNPAFYSSPSEIDFGPIIELNDEISATIYITVFNNPGKTFPSPTLLVRNKILQISLSKKHEPRRVFSVFGEELVQDVYEYTVKIDVKQQVDNRRENEESIFGSLPDGRSFKIPVKWAMYARAKNK